MHFTRRSAIIAAAAFLVNAALMPFVNASEFLNRSRLHKAVRMLKHIEAQSGGRLGVAVIDTADNAQLLYNSHEHFPMCSTFKVLLVAAILTHVDKGSEQLGRWISYASDDIQNYAPITKIHLKKGGMTIEDLCAATLEYSDNTAANLLLLTIGDPKGFTDYVRSLGDDTTRLDRIEPDLNEAAINDIRDTTAPAAMAQDLKKLLLGTMLSAPSSQKLESWMINAKTGAQRLRAGLPENWQIGDKTGTGDHGTSNVIAIIRPPHCAALVAAVYITGSSHTAERRDTSLAEVGRLIVETFGNT